MNTIIVEDEAKQLELLINLIQKHLPELRIVATADAVSTGLSAIRQYQPDLVFLDVEIKGGTSFDLLEQFPNLDAAVIFTTSFEQYAVQAFRLSAVDYLMKPIDEAELINAVDKARARIQAADGIRHLELLLRNYRNTEPEDLKIALPTQKGYDFVQPNDIVRCESDNTYTTFYLTDQRKVVVSRTLKNCEQMLAPFTFCRVHNSSLINLNYITEYVRGEGGIVIMADGSEVAISRRRKEHFLQLFRMQ